MVRELLSLVTLNAAVNRVLKESAMFESSEHADANRTTAHRQEYDLCTRVQAEFQEMPGLILTVAQAARLFSIEPNHCELVLRTLVDAGHLASDGRSFSTPRCGRRYA